MSLIQSLASKTLVRNLPKLKFDQHFCDAFKMGKQAHASHKAKNIVLTSRCLELLHMDLFSPSAIRSYRGNRYTLVIVDDYSRRLCGLKEHLRYLYVRGMLFDILVLEETNRSCYIHYRSRIRKRQKGMDKHAIWMKQRSLDYDVTIDDVPIMCDNKGAIDLSKTRAATFLVHKHQNCSHFLRANVLERTYSIEKVQSDDNITYILTKPLKRESFNYLSLGLGMMEHIP
ncbi:retrovirus-related pol polyprotein from transposon TNT 1-94 [Tanacetum coccineum]